MRPPVTAAVGTTVFQEPGVPSWASPDPEVTVTTPQGHVPVISIRCTSLQLLREHPYRESMPERSILTLYVVGRQSNKHHISGFRRTSANLKNKYLNGSFR